MTAPAGQVLNVVAGALIDAQGRILIADRPPGKSFAGRWEFPGGKCQSGESTADALKRELAEEIGIEVTSAEPLMTVSHRYPGAATTVRIECWRVDGWTGTPQPLDGQQLRWCTRDELAEADILEADRAIVTALRLPRLFVRVAPDEPLDARVAAAGDRDRAAWIVDRAPRDAALDARLAARGDTVCVLDPQTPPRAGEAVVYSDPGRLAGPAAGLVGCLVADAATAVAAVAAGAAFLLVRERDLDGATFRAVAATGLPWYLNVVARSDSPAPAATGTLWWKESPVRGDA